MSGGSFGYAFERPPTAWWDAVGAIEVAALRVQAGYPFAQWHSLDQVPDTTAEFMVEFVKEYRKKVGDEYNPAKPTDPTLDTPEAREVIKSIEWIKSCDSSWRRMTDAVVRWKLAKAE